MRFPGSNCDLDVMYVLKNVIGLDAELIWHKREDLERFDAIILPGGFSYGDYLRAGAIAAHSPALIKVKRLAENETPILGICNGFQMLVESGLLPGALLTNSSLKFICKWVCLRVENDKTPFTKLFRRREVIRMPIAHNEGRYYVDPDTLEDMEEKGQIVFRYSNENGDITEESNPNGSVGNIAGVCNKEGNVVGLMPHPERASEKILSLFSTEDGLRMFLSLLKERS